MVTRSEIVSLARSYVGTRWVHQGRSRNGVDCVGLVIAVAMDAGILPRNYPIPPYSRFPDNRLQDYFQSHLVRIPPRKAGNGSVLLFSFHNSPWHAGIMVDVNARSLVHAFASARKVVYDYADSRAHGRKLFAAFDYPGVTDG